MATSFDLAFDHNNQRFRANGPISLMAALRHDCGDDERERRNVRAGPIRPMNRSSRPWETLFAGVGLGLLTLDGPAFAADLPASMPVKAPVPYVSTTYDWNGWYVGAHVGVIRGSS